MTDRTHLLLGAHEQVAAFIRSHALQADHTEYQLNPVQLIGCPPVVVRVSSFRDPAVFLAWCDALTVEKVGVHRRDWDVCFNTHADIDGLTWRVAGSISRPATGPALPGIPPPWRRNRNGRLSNDGVVTVDELRAVLGLIRVTALNVEEG